MIKKLSLAAVVAMTSVSFASAANLSKTSISGSLSYELTKMDSEEASRHHAELKLSAKIDDKLKVDTKFVSYGANGDNDSTVHQGYFYGTYTGVTNTTILGGLTPLLTPFTDNSDDYGDGAIALYKVNDALTVGGAAFLNATIDNKIDATHQLNNNIYALTATGKAASMVKYNFWFVQVQDLVDSALYGKVTANVKGNGATVELISKNPHGTSTADADQTQTRVVLQGNLKVATLNAHAGMVISGADGGAVQIGSDNKFIAPGEQTSFDAAKERAYYATAMYNVTPAAKVGMDLVYQSNKSNATNGKLVRSVEAVVRAGFNYNKALSVGAYYSVIRNSDTLDSRKVDLKMAYKF